MNDFKESLKEEVNKSDVKKLTDDEIKDIDKKIINSIVEKLSTMLENSKDNNEKTQIMDRMLNLNNLFNKGFDQEIRKLHHIERIENEESDEKEN